MNFIFLWLISLPGGGGIYVVSTDMDVPVIWYEYGSVILVQGTCMTSTFYQMVLLWVVILYQVKNTFYCESWRYSNIDLHVRIITGSSGSSDRPRTSSRIGSILSVAFQLLYSVDFLRCYGSITE